jgi:hypothetical protein
VAYEISNYSVKVTLVAAADLSTNQYNFVKLDSDGNAAAVAATSDQAIGVLQNDSTQPQNIVARLIGNSKNNFISPTIGLEAVPPTLPPARFNFAPPPPPPPELLIIPE